VGSVALSPRGEEIGWLSKLFVDAAYRGRGLGRRLLARAVDEARARGYRRMSLETGSMVFFEPARNLYRRYGFEPCPPFADYWDDPNSFFMTRRL